MPRRKKKDGFEQSGVFKIKMKIDIEITEGDLLKDLAKNTEGIKINVDTPKGTQNN